LRGSTRTTKARLRRVTALRETGFGDGSRRNPTHHFVEHRSFDSLGVQPIQHAAVSHERQVVPGAENLAAGRGPLGGEGVHRGRGLGDVAGVELDVVLAKAESLKGREDAIKSSGSRSHPARSGS